MKKPNREIFVFESDSHAGMTYGLMYPDTQLIEETHDGKREYYTPAQREIQKLLCEIRENNLKLAKSIAGKDPITYFHNGDITHGTKYPEFLVSTAMSAQLTIARRNLQEMYSVLGDKTKTVLIEGTGAHNFGEGSAEVMLYEELKGKHPIMHHRHMMYNSNGFRIDIAHHGAGVGIRQWTKGNAMRYYTASIMIEDLVNGTEPPDLVVRGHFHTHHTEVLQVGELRRKETRIINLPAMCGMNTHSRQATRSTSYVSFGLCIVEVIDGKIARQWDDETVRWYDVRTNNIDEFTEGDWYDQ